VEAAGNIRACDDIEHRLVIAQTPDSEAFTKVGVEVDGAHVDKTRA
jgi:hypothetical protein